MDSRGFWEDMWEFVGSHPPTLPKKLVSDIYAVGWKIQRGEGGSWWECLCWCAKDLAKYGKGRLPDNLHNRMVLGEQNRHTVAYVRMWGA